MTNHLKNNNT